MTYDRISKLGVQKANELIEKFNKLDCEDLIRNFEEFQKEFEDLEILIMAKRCKEYELRNHK